MDMLEEVEESGKINLMNNTQALPWRDTKETFQRVSWALDVGIGIGTGEEGCSESG